MLARPRVLLPLTGLLVAGSLAMTSCASSGGSAGSSATPPGQSSSMGGASTTPNSISATTTTTSSGGGSAAALLPASVKSKGTITFAMDATYPPDEMIKPGSSSIEGFDADLANAIAGALGLKAQLQNVTFDNIIPGLASGKYDVGMSSFTDTKEREKTVDFVDYFQAGEGFYVKAGSSKKFDGLASLCNATVAVENGTTEQTDAQAQAKKCKITVLTFPDQNAVNLAVSSGRADVGFADSQVAAYIVKQSNGQFQNTGTAFEVAPYGIATPKGNGMDKAIQAALQQLSSNGQYTQILSKWGVQAGAVKTFTLDGATS